AAGFGLTCTHWRRLWVLYAIILVYAASVIAFYVMARYRFPVVPALMLFAAAALVSLWDAARGKTDAPQGWAAFLCLIAATAVWLETRPIRNGMVRGSIDQNLG